MSFAHKNAVLKLREESKKRKEKCKAAGIGGVLKLDQNSGGTDYTFHRNPKSLDKVWLSFGKYSINIHKTDEGVVVDIFQKGKEDRGSLESCYAYDTDILTDEEYEEELERLERDRIETEAGRTD